MTVEQTILIDKLEPRLQQLLTLSYKLLEREQQSNEPLSDYSFIVFPAAKAYEGFLKQYLYDLHLISQYTFEGRKLRIGRTLNPDVHANQRDEFWLYDDLERLCSPALAHELWITWLNCRNKIFHFFPTESLPTTLEQAASNLLTLQNAMSHALECKVELDEYEAHH